MRKRRTVLQHLRGLWDIHWSVKMLAALWLALTATETILPFCPDSWSKNFYSLTYIPHFKWYVWVISALAILVIVIFDASLRYANKNGEFAQPNLVWESIGGGPIGREIGIWSRTPSHGYTSLSKSIKIKNVPKYDEDVSAISVRAEMTILDEKGERILSPLTWINYGNASVEIGVGEYRELLLAKIESLDMWDFIVNGTSGAAESCWISIHDFKLHVRILDNSGREVPVQPPIRIKWQWREDRRLPWLVQE